MINPQSPLVFSFVCELAITCLVVLFHLSSVLDLLHAHIPIIQESQAFSLNHFLMTYRTKDLEISRNPVFPGILKLLQGKVLYKV